MDADGLDISLGPEQVLGLLVREKPTHRTDVYVARAGAPDRRALPTFVSVDAWQEMLQHLGQGGDLEVTGLLVGAPCLQGAQEFLDITGVLPAVEATGSSYHVTIDQAAWERLLARQEDRDPSERIAGWYHSHPSLGIFLSEQDRFVHRHFFAQPWQVALVVDPVGQHWGLFGWSDGALAPSGGLHLYGSRSERAAVDRFADVATKTLVRRQK